jgi:hypothetical protein
MFCMTEQDRQAIDDNLRDLLAVRVGEPSAAGLSVGGL